jgi:hypothetical protein
VPLSIDRGFIHLALLSGPRIEAARFVPPQPGENTAGRLRCDAAPLAAVGVRTTVKQTLAFQADGGRLLVLSSVGNAKSSMLLEFALERRQGRTLATQLPARNTAMLLGPNYGALSAIIFMDESSCFAVGTDEGFVAVLDARDNFALIAVSTAALGRVHQLCCRGNTIVARMQCAIRVFSLVDAASASSTRARLIVRHTIWARERNFGQQIALSPHSGRILCVPSAREVDVYDISQQPETQQLPRRLGENLVPRLTTLNLAGGRNSYSIQHVIMLDDTHLLVSDRQRPMLFNVALGAYEVTSLPTSFGSVSLAYDERRQLLMRSASAWGEKRRRVAAI